jgi:hypothetical protein
MAYFLTCPTTRMADSCESSSDLHSITLLNSLLKITGPLIDIELLKGGGGGVA